MNFKSIKTSTIYTCILFLIIVGLFVWLVVTQLEEFTLQNSYSIDLRVGQAIVFWAGLWHGSKVNTEKRTRLSINFRVKSLFSPSGRKDPTNYFDLYSSSNITKLALRVLE